MRGYNKIFNDSGFFWYFWRDKSYLDFNQFRLKLGKQPSGSCLAILITLIRDAFSDKQNLSIIKIFSDYFSLVTIRRTHHTNGLPQADLETFLIKINDFLNVLLYVSIKVYLPFISEVNHHDFDEFGRSGLFKRKHFITQ